MALQLFTFEYINRRIYISNNFACHDQLNTSYEIDYDKRCEYTEKQYLSNITHGICKCKSESFKLIIDWLENIEKCELKLIDSKNIDVVKEFDENLLKNNNIYSIEVILPDHFKMDDFIGLIMYNVIQCTFYNNDSEFWYYYNIMNNIK